MAAKMKNLFKKLVFWLMERAIKKGQVYNITGRDKEDRDIYMIRYIVFKTKWFGIYIHRFVRSDDDTHHDHPWCFFTYMVEDGYAEQIVKKVYYNKVNHYWMKTTIRTKPGQLLFRKGTHIHRVILDKHYQMDELDKAPLTFVIIGPKYREWGFWSPKGAEYTWQHWRSFLHIPKGPNKEHVGISDE